MQLLKNIVFLKLKRRCHNIYYGALKQGFKLDFISEDNNGVFHKFQVVNDLSTPQKIKNTLKPFSMAEPNYKNNNLVLTMNKNEEIITFRGTNIKTKYLIKWLLDL